MNKNITKDYQINPVSKAKYQNSFDNFIYSELLPHIKRYKSYSKSQSTIAKIIGTSTTTVENHYRRLRQDPRFFVSKPVRNDFSPRFFPVTVTFSYKYKSCQSEYLGELSLSNSISFNSNSLISSYITNQSLITHHPNPRARAQDGLQKTRKRWEQEKRRRSLAMQELPQLQNVIPEGEAIARIRVYPNEALIYADNAIKFAKPTSAIRLFCFLANEYCRNNAVIPQWAIWYDYKREKKLANDFPLLKLKAIQSQKREMHGTRPSLNASVLNDIVSRKACKLFSEGKKSQLSIMLVLESLAKSYPQAESDWKNWIQTKDGQDFSNWIRIYARQHKYTAWNPFTFDRKEHNRKYDT